MFIIKKKYYLYIENTQDIDFEKIRRSNKFIIIYRNNKGQECKKKIIEFKKKCSKKNFLFFVSNDSKLAIDCKADGLYLSSYNKSKVYNQNKNVIGSAHNYKEIYEKIKQGCKTIVLSRLFKTSYANKKSYFGITKFNLIQRQYSVEIVPLGGINASNLLKLNLIKSSGCAFLSSVKKKPAISNRLF